MDLVSIPLGTINTKDAESDDVIITMFQFH